MDFEVIKNKFNIKISKFLSCIISEQINNNNKKYYPKIKPIKQPNMMSEQC